MLDFIKINHRLLFFVIYFCFSELNAQTPDWAISMGGSSSESSTSLALDSLGNVYSAGYFKLTADFDPGIGVANITSNGSSDLYIQKLSASGSLLWVKSFGGTALEGVHEIALDNFHNIYMIGNFQKTVDFDPGPGTFNMTSIGNFDVFILKLDSSGNFVWAKSFGSNFECDGRSISLDDSANVYTTGYFSQTVDFDPGIGTYYLSPLGSNDIFIHKLDKNGNFLWVKNMGSPIAGNIELGYSVKTDKKGNIFTTGSFLGTTDFDPSAGTYTLACTGGRNAFIQKLNSSGNFIWARAINGDSLSEGHRLEIDGVGNVYTLGTYRYIMDFDPGPGVFNMTSFPGKVDIFIQKLDSAGNFLWAKSMGGVLKEYYGDLILDGSGNLYSTGSFSGQADFDPGPGNWNLVSNGAIDIYIHKMDENGAFLWAKNIGGTASDQGISITSNSLGDVYVSGFYADTVDFDPGPSNYFLNSAGSIDAFIMKLNDTSSVTETSEIPIEPTLAIFPNPIHDIISIFHSLEITEIIITDIMGRQIY